MFKNILQRKRSDKSAKVIVKGIDKGTSIDEDYLQKPKADKCSAECRKVLEDTDSCSDLVYLVLKYFGSSSKKIDQGIQTCPNIFFKEGASCTGPQESKENVTQTPVVDRIEACTGECQEIPRTEGMSFRYFFGPSLEETGIYVMDSVPIIRQAYHFFKLQLIRLIGAEAI